LRQKPVWTKPQSDSTSSMMDYDPVHYTDALTVSPQHIFKVICKSCG